MSQHEGRESETAEREMHLGKEKVLLLAVEMVNNKLRKSGRLATGDVDELVKTLNAKYNAKIKLSEVLSALEESGAELDEKHSMLKAPGAEEEEEEAEEPVGEPEEEVEQEEKEALSGEEVELLAFPANVKEEQAKAMFNSIRKKKFLGLIGEEEGLDSVQLRYLPVFRVELHAFGNKQAFHRVEAFINSVSGEFMHFLPSKRQFVESKGLQQLNELSEREVKLLLALENRKKEFAAIVQQMEEDEAVVKRTVRNLLEKGYVKIEESAGTDFVSTVKEIDLPSNALHPLLASLSRLPVENATAISLMHAAIDRNALPKMLKKLWQNAIVKKIDVVYLPVFESFLKKKDGSVRRLFIEAVTGKKWS
jgi:transcription antitermination factor NusG